MPVVFLQSCITREFGEVRQLGLQDTDITRSLARIKRLQSEMEDLFGYFFARALMPFALPSSRDLS